VLTAAMTACNTGPGHVQGIRVASAIYSVEDKTVPCEVTSKLANICNGLSSCSVHAHSRLCPMGDPAPTRQKYLTVEYACGVGTLRAEVADGRQLTLTCPP
jgi:hypothetical protein